LGIELTEPRRTSQDCPPRFQMDRRPQRPAVLAGPDWLVQAAGCWLGLLLAARALDRRAADSGRLANDP
jgi:hypothetical protein